jgi:hypothetical protein
MRTRSVTKQAIEQNRLLGYLRTSMFAAAPLASQQSSPILAPDWPAKPPAPDGCVSARRKDTSGIGFEKF